MLQIAIIELRDAPIGFGVLEVWAEDDQGACVTKKMTMQVKAAAKIGIEWHQTGSGFVFDPDKMGEAKAKTQRAWALAQDKIASGEYDLIVLDEFTYALDFGWLDTAEVLAWLDEHKPPELHLIVTGRDAVPELLEYADLVTDMGNVKHPFDQGVQAQRGIAFTLHGHHPRLHYYAVAVGVALHGHDFGGKYLFIHDMAGN